MKDHFYPRIGRDRSLLAEATDCLLLGALLYLTFRLWTRRAAYPILTSGFLTAAVLIPVLLLDGKRREHRQHTALDRFRKDLILEKLLLLTDSEVCEALGSEPMLRRSTVAIDDLAMLIRNGISAAWLCGTIDDEAQAFAKRYADRLQIHSAEKTARRFAVLVSEQDAAEEWERRRQSRKALWRMRLKTIRVNRFLLLGLALTGLSAMTSYRLYYRLLASASFLIGGFALVLKQMGKRTGIQI